MKLAKLRINDSEAIGRVAGETIEVLDLDGSGAATLQDILAMENPAEAASAMPVKSTVAAADAQLLAPIDAQEVWAAGVTYKRSQTARMEESEAAASCYDRVYNSPRPEIFFKATPHRVRGHGEALRIRQDATWNVPEPELTLVLNPSLKIVGYTVGNDMSSRDIEGDNPLYLPQAKMYDQCCGLGPWITLADSLPDRDQATIDLKILRAGSVVFDQATSVEQMARTPEDLVQWLGRDNSFPCGAFLLTGTGIVPDSDFTLAAGDEVRITIDGIGMLSNTIVQG